MSIHIPMSTHLCGLLEVSVDHGVEVCVNVCPEREGGGVDGQVVSLTITVTEKRSKPQHKRTHLPSNSTHTLATGMTLEFRLYSGDMMYAYLFAYTHL